MLSYQVSGSSNLFSCIQYIQASTQRKTDFHPHHSICEIQIHNTPSTHAIYRYRKIRKFGPCQKDQGNIILVEEWHGLDVETDEKGKETQRGMGKCGCACFIIGEVMVTASGGVRRVYKASGSAQADRWTYMTIDNSTPDKTHKLHLPNHSATNVSNTVMNQSSVISDDWLVCAVKLMFDYKSQSYK